VLQPDSMSLPANTLHLPDRELLRVVERELARRLEALQPPPTTTTDSIVSPNRGAICQLPAASSSSQQPHLAHRYLPLDIPKSSPQSSETASSSSSLPPSSQYSSSQQGHPKSGATAISSSHSGRTPRTERIKVVLRVRPFIENEISESCVQLPADRRSITCSRVQTFESRDFFFDRVLPPTTTQGEMYGAVAQDIVDGVLEGYNGTILAYGQTGTGKTFTVFGREPPPTPGRPSQPVAAHLFADSGILPLSVHYLFDRLSARPSQTTHRITISCVEIYMENLIDLLDISKTGLTIRDDLRGGVCVHGLTQVAVETARDALTLISQCAQARTQAATHMNEVSSRSHVVLLLSVEQRDPHPITGGIRKGILTVVDLAGSERVGKSGSAGRRLDEAKVINKSLSTLGKCVFALGDPTRTHVPFRDSKLTRLLSSSLGGNARTCLVATIGPSATHYDDTLSTLLFATRAMAVQNSVVPNEVPTEASGYVSLLEAKVAALEAENSSLAQRLESIVSAPAAPAPAACPEPAEWQQKEQLYLKLVDRLQAEVSRLAQTLAEHQAAAASAAEHAVAGVAQELLQVPALRDAMLSSLRTIPNASISEIGCESQPSSSLFPRNACSVPTLCAQQLKDYSAKHGGDAAMLFSSMNPPLSHPEAHQSYSNLCFAPPSGLVNGGVWKGPSSGQPLPPRKSVSSMEPLCDVASMSSMSFASDRASSCESLRMYQIQEQLRSLAP